MIGPENPAPVEWAKIGRAIANAEAHYVHHSVERLYGDAYYAAVAKRALGGDKQDRLSYETVSPSLGLVSMAQHDWTLSGHLTMERLRAERAEREVSELRAEVKRIRRDAWRDAAKNLREWCNERRIPARYRREGWLMAADQIDPDVPRNKYGEAVR